MQIIISPAKLMQAAFDDFAPKNQPLFLAESTFLTNYIQQLSYAEAQQLWQSNDKITQLNYDRFAQMNLYANLSAAVMTYDGLQYQAMAPSLLTTPGLAYLEKHLRILSAFYGILRPFDGITPYRLELQSKVNFDYQGQHYVKLYPFWGDKIYQALMADNNDRIIINLASREYSKVVLPYLQPDDQLISCTFASIKANQKLQVKTTESKIARGDMVRFMAERNITDANELKTFTARGFHFVDDLSTADNFVFIK